MTRGTAARARGGVIFMTDLDYSPERYETYARGKSGLRKREVTKGEILQGQELISDLAHYCYSQVLAVRLP